MTSFRIVSIAVVFFLITNPNSLLGQTVTQKSEGRKTAAKPKKAVLTGQASYYHHKFHGRKMANGENYSKHELTAACNRIALHKWVRVTNTVNGRSVIVKITDRMHKKNRRLIDLSYAAAVKLKMVSHGLVKVKVEILNSYIPPKKK